MKYNTIKLVMNLDEKVVVAKFYMTRILVWQTHLQKCKEDGSKKTRDELLQEAEFEAEAGNLHKVAKQESKHVKYFEENIDDAVYRVQDMWNRKAGHDNYQLVLYPDSLQEDFVEKFADGSYKNALFIVEGKTIDEINIVTRFKIKSAQLTGIDLVKNDIYLVRKEEAKKTKEEANLQEIKSDPAENEETTTEATENHVQEAKSEPAEGTRTNDAHGRLVEYHAGGWHIVRKDDTLSERCTTDTITHW